MLKVAPEPRGCCVLGKVKKWGFKKPELEFRNPVLKKKKLWLSVNTNEAKWGGVSCLI